MSHSTTIPDRDRPHEGPTARRLLARLSGGERWFTAVRVVLGLLLLTAAGLKLAGMNVTALPRVGWFSTPRVQVAAVAWELVLGLWLLSGAYRLGAWLAAAGTFLTFAGVSGYLGWAGVANCGCLGVIKASPWLTFAFDIVAVACLLLWRPAGVFDMRAASPSIRQIAWPALGAVVIVIAAGSVLVYRYGSVAGAWAALRQQPCSVEPAVTDVGAAPVGTVREVAVQFVNHSNDPVRVLGGSSNCSCVTMATSSIVVPAHESRPIPVRVAFTGSAGAFWKRVTIYYDHANNQREAVAQIGGRVEGVP